MLVLGWSYQVSGSPRHVDRRNKAECTIIKCQTNDRTRINSPQRPQNETRPTTCCRALPDSTWKKFYSLGTPRASFGDGNETRGGNGQLGAVRCAAQSVYLAAGGLHAADCRKTSIVVTFPVLPCENSFVTRNNFVFDVRQEHKTQGTSLNPVGIASLQPVDA